MSKVKNFIKLITVGLRNEYYHISVKPLNALAFLTYRCTSKCKTCNIWRWPKDNYKELTKEEWLKVLNQLHSNGIKSFEIFGGDALLRKDAVFDVIRFCSNSKIHTHFPTNGNLCDQDTVKALIDSGLYTVYLSIDDIESEHDYIRGSHGTFNRVKNALEMFLDIRKTAKYPKIIICTTLSCMNYKNFPNLVEFFEKYKIDAIFPRIVGEFNRDNIEKSKINEILPEPCYTSEDTSHLFNLRQLEELKDIITRVKKTDYKTYINFRAVATAKDKTFLNGEYDIKNCHIATTLVTVTPYGDVSPCPFFPSYKIGNLLKCSLNEIWGNTKHREFIKLQRKGQLAICRNCNLRVYYPSIMETFSWKWRRIINS